MRSRVAGTGRFPRVTLAFIYTRKDSAPHGLCQEILIPTILQYPECRGASGRRFSGILYKCWLWRTTRLILSLSKYMSCGSYARSLPAHIVRHAHPRTRYGAGYERDGSGTPTNAGNCHRWQEHTIGIPASAESRRPVIAHDRPQPRIGYGAGASQGWSGGWPCVRAS